VDQDQRFTYQYRLRSIFRPGAPINSQALFSGRTKQINAVLNATFQAGQHIVMYGERGVGKTSLAKSLADILKNAGVTPLSSGTVNCDGTDDFSSLWHKIFRELQVVIKTEKAGFSPTREEVAIDLHGLLPEKVTPDDVRVAITNAVSIAASDRQMIIILDEVDRITERNVTTLLADTIKNLSDHLVPVTLLLVGVADAVDQLVSEHQSVERSLVQVRMPRMQPSELEQVIDKGIDFAQMTVSPSAKGQIIALSQGLPHFTHLLALQSANAALERDSIDIDFDDVLSSTRTAVSESHSLLSAYHRATNSPQKNSLFEEVILACALAEKDELGWFTASSVSQPLSLLMGKTYSLPYFARHLNEFAESGRGPIIHKYGTHRQHKYRFVNPLMEPFAIIRALSCDMLKNVDGKLVPRASLG
jgi:Cdc6-like AAA superfamily ATPase